MNDMQAVKFHQSQLFLVYPVDKFRLCSSGRGGGGGGGGELHIFTHAIPLLCVACIYPIIRESPMYI